jgi:hypothetical protein
VGTYTVTGRRLGGYDRRRDPVSALARTEVGWVQTLNFLVSGGLTLAGSAGIRRALPAGIGKRSIPRLVTAVGTGLLGAGVFATDLAEETARDGLSRRGALHTASAVPFFVGLPAACVISAFRFADDDRGALAVISVSAGALSIAAATLAGAGFAGKQPWDARAGTYQRIAIAAGFGWMSLFVRTLLVADGEQ